MEEKIKAGIDTTDLSYSKIVDMVQKEDIKGADLLNKIAVEYVTFESLIDENKKQIRDMENRRERLMAAARLVMKHLQKEFSLVVKRQNHVVTISPNNMKINQNTI